MTKIISIFLGFRNKLADHFVHHFIRVFSSIRNYDRRFISHRNHSWSNDSHSVFFPQHFLFTHVFHLLFNLVIHCFGLWKIQRKFFYLSVDKLLCLNIVPLTTSSVAIFSFYVFFLEKRLTFSLLFKMRVNSFGLSCNFPSNFLRKR